MPVPFSQDPHEPTASAAPTTVWPAPPPVPGGWAPSWLRAAVERLVVTHTQPGDLVLLLTPPQPEPQAAPAAIRTVTADEQLIATSWTVARLGRTVRVQTAPTPSQTGPYSREVATGLESDRDRCPLVVTVIPVVPPARLAWTDHIPWGRLVAPDGLLAVITHTDSHAGWLIDPTSDLTLATGRHGLALRDRFVLLEVPLDTVDIPPAPADRANPAPRVHSDLLLFSPVQPTSPEPPR
jgi:hypothetical protein